MMNIPDPNAVFPNEYKTSCFIKNVVTAPNITVGDYTYYDDAVDPTGFERNNVLFNYPEFGDHLVIGKFCQIASGTKFIMGPANHRISSATTYPFNVIGGAWTICCCAISGGIWSQKSWWRFCRCCATRIWKNSGAFCGSSLQIDKTEDG